MTQDEIIEMARQAHRKLVTEVYVGHMGQLDPWTIELLKIFAQLVDAKATAKEREACAMICDATVDYWVKAGYLECAQVIEAMNIAEEIRARG